MSRIYTFYIIVINVELPEKLLIYEYTVESHGREI